ncbi:MAG: translation elongation factor Ts [Thermoleophilia bacterium]
MTISASLVKELRERTSAGMMDCKRALEDTGGDLDAAVKLLREKGIAAAGKRADRATTEGKVIARTGGAATTMVAVGCETEPVSNNDEFLAFASAVLDAVEQGGADAVASLEERRVELVAKLGENIGVVGAARYDAGSGIVAAYVHPPASKIGVLVRLEGGSEELARQVAMHVSFAAPRYVARDEVPADAVAAEREILEKLPDVQSKPENIRPKIVEGMLQKRFFAESVLADQAWIHDDSKTVGQALGAARVVEFVRFALAG